MNHRIVVALAGFLLAVGAVAESPDPPGPRGEGAFDRGNPRVVAELLVDAASVRAGSTVRVGVLFTMDPGWHVYWRHSGDSGTPTALAWRVPGEPVGPTGWPAPRVFREADVLTTFGYEGSVLLAAEARVPEEVHDTWRVEVDARFGACETQCIRDRLQLAREVPVSETGTPAALEVRERFDRARARLPRPPEALGVSVQARPSRRSVGVRDEFRIAVEIGSCSGGGDDCVPWALGTAQAHEAFVPDRIQDLQLEALGPASPEPDPRGAAAFSVVLGGRAWSDLDLEGQLLRGVVPLARKGETAHLEVEVPLGPARAGGFEIVDPPAASRGGR